MISGRTPLPHWLAALMLAMTPALGCNSVDFFDDDLSTLKKICVYQVDLDDVFFDVRN